MALSENKRLHKLAHKAYRKLTAANSNVTTWEKLFVEYVTDDAAYAIQAAAAKVAAVQEPMGMAPPPPPAASPAALKEVISEALRERDVGLTRELATLRANIVEVRDHVGQRPETAGGYSEPAPQGYQRQQQGYPQQGQGYQRPRSDQRQQRPERKRPPNAGFDADGRIICNYCGKSGHIIAECRTRKMEEGTAAARGPRQQPPQQQQSFGSGFKRQRQDENFSQGGGKKPFKGKGGYQGRPFQSQGAASNVQCDFCGRFNHTADKCFFKKKQDEEQQKERQTAAIAALQQQLQELNFRSQGGRPSA
eukprot:tig00000025_g7964.t1